MAEEEVPTRFVRFSVILPAPENGEFGEKIDSPEAMEFSNNEKFLVTKSVTCFEHGALPVERRPIFAVNILVPEAELVKWRHAPNYLDTYCPNFRNFGSIVYPVPTKVNVSRDIVPINSTVPINSIVTQEYAALSINATGTLVTGHHLTFRPKPTGNYF